MHLGPLCLLLLDDSLEEVVRGFGCSSCELIGPALLRDHAKVITDFADDAGLFPGLTFGSVLSGCFIELPTAFGEDPAATTCGLDKEHVELVGGERNNTCD